MVKVIDTIEAFLKLKTDWDALCVSSVGFTPFQTFAYNYLSWTEFMHNTGQLYIFLVTDNSSNQIDAIFPCYLDHRKTLRFINDRHTDFCSAIIRKEREPNYQLYEEIASYLNSDQNIRSICFDNLEANNSLKAVLKPFFKNVFIYDFNACSDINIKHVEGDKDFLDAIRYINGKRKKNLKTKLLKDKNIELLIYKYQCHQSFPIKDVHYLCDLMISKRERSHEYFSSSMIRYWEKLYEAGILTLAALYQEDVVKTINFMFYNPVKNEYIKWIMLYEDKHYNLTLNLKLIEHIYNNGGASINFARGIYDYKMMNFHPQVHNLYRLVITKSSISSVSALLTLNIHYLKMIIKSIIRK